MEFSEELRYLSSVLEYRVDCKEISEREYKWKIDKRKRVIDHFECEVENLIYSPTPTTADDEGTMFPGNRFKLEGMTPMKNSEKKFKIITKLNFSIFYIYLECFLFYCFISSPDWI